MISSPGHQGAHVNVFLELYNRLLSHFGPQEWWPADTPFEVVIGAILTQNTSWTNVERAIANLKEEEVLNAEALHEIPERRLAVLLRPAGYFNVKARRTKAFMSFLHEAYGGSLDAMFRQPLPRLRGQLLDIHGIGPETADSILLYAGRYPVFVIDAYSTRIFTRHDLIDGRVGYREIQSRVMSHIPPDVEVYQEYHALLVRLGKIHCKRTPECSGCPLGGVNGIS